jgi:predicted GNAT family acetyltransferase
MQELDNPIWYSLTTNHASFAIGDLFARRYPLDIAPFCAVENFSNEAVASLRNLIEADATARLFSLYAPALPKDWQHIRSLPMYQMVCETLERVPKTLVEELGTADYSEMFELATLTEPGPFRQRTPELGRFVGIRQDGQLIAMAGERLKLKAFTEISGVCTHPDYRGRGYAKMLVQTLAQGILEQAKLPFLHVKIENESAFKAYEKLGFKTRCIMNVVVLKAN